MRIQHNLKQDQRLELTRTRYTRESAQQKVVKFKRQRFLNFSSNDYLGLANHQEVIANAELALKKYGIGSGSSQLISGHHLCHEMLEEYAADWLQCERTLLFSNGYMANLGVVTALSNANTVIIQDKHNHASLIDAAKLSDSTTRRYAHLNLEHCESLLHKHLEQEKLLISETIFSMDGTQLAVDDWLALAQKYHATPILDDAHAIGWLGHHGAGVSSIIEKNCTLKPIIICPLGKALGCYGAIVGGTTEQIEHIMQFARTYIYTTAQPPALAAASLASIRIAQQESWRRERLQQLIRYFRDQTSELNLPFIDSHSPIQCLPVKSAKCVLTLSEQLKQEHLFVAAIRPPTAKTSRLRISLTCEHTEMDIDYLLKHLCNYYVNPS